MPQKELQIYTILISWLHFYKAGGQKDKTVGMEMSQCFPRYRQGWYKEALKNNFSDETFWILINMVITLIYVFVNTCRTFTKNEWYTAKIVSYIKLGNKELLHWNIRQLENLIEDKILCKIVAKKN